MGVPVILTPQSQADLREIVSFIARDNPDQAVRFGDALIDEALSFHTFPERGRMVPELRLESVREIIQTVRGIVTAHGSIAREIGAALNSIRFCRILRLTYSCSVRTLTSYVGAVIGFRLGLPAFGTPNQSLIHFQLS